MMDNRLVIGVVGSSRGKPSKDIIELAGKVGKKIIKEEHVLLTGGTPKSDVSCAERINDAAMTGAKNAGTESSPARLISVLRKGGFSVVYDPKPTYGCITIKTSLGDARNYINGYIPDVVIAIGGGGGTFSEIASALTKNTPIVLLQDINRKKYDEIRQDIEREFKQCLYDLDSTLSHLTSNQCIIAHSASKAVEKAINAKKPCNSNRLPKHRGLDPLCAEYEEYLNALVKLGNDKLNLTN